MTLFVSDLDGTLLDNSCKLRPRCIDMMNSMIDKGLQFTYATARSFKSAENLVKELHLTLPVILFNGTFIYDFQDDKYISKNILSQESVSLLKQYVIKYAETPLIYSFINGVEKISYLANSTSIRGYLNTHRDDERLNKCDSYAEMFEGEIFFVTLINPKSSVENLDAVFNNQYGFTRNYQQDTYDANEYWYEISSKDAGKANAVRQLKEYLGAEKTVCFGDNLNDLEMIENADIGVAVANANAEVQNAADEITLSNMACGVPYFIERLFYKKRTYNYPEEMIVKPDHKRFQNALLQAAECCSQSIGTMNEKMAHSALKYYYTNDFDHEVKIGRFIADAVGENGIYEIQTANFGKLYDKLSTMLEASHVTVVYPFTKHTNNRYLDDKTGEIIRENTSSLRCLSKFFLELYRIKAFLTNPNLSICIAELEFDKTIFIDASKNNFRNISKSEKTPIKLLSEIYIRTPQDYLYFLPKNLPEIFTKRDFALRCKIGDASIILNILHFVNVVEICGTKGKAFLYKVVNQNQDITFGGKYDNFLSI